jgi:hypothetical protein
MLSDRLKELFVFRLIDNFLYKSENDLHDLKG